MTTISIIIPLFYGKKYLNSIYRMIDDNVESLHGKLPVSVQLVLVNDSDEMVELPCKKEKWDVKLVNNITNMGIHGSRTEGLKYAAGEWILFLDQDDRISGHYILSQMTNIQDEDISLCNGKNWNTLIYGENRSTQNVLDFDYLMRHGNQIISPGLTVIRKSSIPTEWKESKLVNNGADDFFLWILMAKNQCKYRYVDECLYCHTITGGNVSLSENNMYRSVQEVQQCLRKMQIIPENESFFLPGSQRLNADKYSSEQNLLRERTNSVLLNRWLDVCQRGMNLSVFFEKRNMYRIAVYGAGILGKHLLQELRGTSINVCTLVDGRKGVECAGMISCGIDEIDETVDAIVVTPAHAFSSIHGNLCDLYGVTISDKVISIVEVIGNVDTELD